KPFGMALSPDGQMLATLNSGAAPFSLTLISQINSGAPVAKRIDLNASFLGVTFSPDSKRIYVSGGENGNIWIADAVAGRIIGSGKFYGAGSTAHGPPSPSRSPARPFVGPFPANR